MCGEPIHIEPEALCVTETASYAYESVVGTAVLMEFKERTEIPRVTICSPSLRVSNDLADVLCERFPVSRIRGLTPLRWRARRAIQTPNLRVW